MYLYTKSHHDKATEGEEETTCVETVTDRSFSSSLGICHSVHPLPPSTHSLFSSFTSQNTFIQFPLSFNPPVNSLILFNPSFN
jgi:hypothetical protein